LSEGEKMDAARRRAARGHVAAPSSRGRRRAPPRKRQPSLDPLQFARSPSPRCVSRRGVLSANETAPRAQSLATKGSEVTQRTKAHCFCAKLRHHSVLHWSLSQAIGRPVPEVACIDQSTPVRLSNRRREDPQLLSNSKARDLRARTHWLQGNASRSLQPQGDIGVDRPMSRLVRRRYRSASEQLRGGPRAAIYGHQEPVRAVHREWRRESGCHSLPVVWTCRVCRPPPRSAR